MKNNRILYVSSSIIPSYNANSIHVIYQCHALAKLSLIIDLVASTEKKKYMTNEVKILDQHYGLNLENINLRLLKLPFNRGINFLIAIYASLLKIKSHYDFVYSRNLYASFFIGFLLRTNVYYEIHEIESGVRGLFQKITFKSKKVTPIVISRSLQDDILKKFVSSKKVYVLPDAASNFNNQFSFEEINDFKNKILPQHTNYTSIIGYIGSIHKGRGIELIEKLAERNNHLLFFIVGGDKNFAHSKNKNKKIKNIFYLSQVKYVEARKMMLIADILLMPYQKKVSIGVDGHDTSSWMSPLKLFEYMASKKPIISSNLNVLCEILSHNKNSLLCNPSDINQWSLNLNLLLKDDKLRKKISNSALRLFNKKYTWDIRAKKILNIIKND